MLQKRDIPDYLCGKISFELMREPCITPSGITSRPLWLVEEGRDENTGVQVERGMPPPVREIQHLTSLDGALQGPCRWCQGWVHVLKPGQRGFIGMELGCLLRGV